MPNSQACEETFGELWEDHRTIAMPISPLRLIWRHPQCQPLLEHHSKKRKAKEKPTNIYSLQLKVPFSS